MHAILAVSLIATLFATCGYGYTVLHMKLVQHERNVVALLWLHSVAAAGLGLFSFVTGAYAYGAIACIIAYSLADALLKRDAK